MKDFLPSCRLANVIGKNPAVELMVGQVRGKTFIAMKDRLWSMKGRGLPDQSSCGSSAGQIQKFMTSLPDYLKVVREDPTNFSQKQE